MDLNTKKNLFKNKLLHPFYCLLVTLPLLSNAQSSKKTFKTGDALLISEAVLKDKIKGGWAGQTIGVTFGGPYEFRFNGTFIQDYQPLEWGKDNVKQNMLNNAGL